MACCTLSGISDRAGGTRGIIPLFRENEKMIGKYTRR